MPLVSDFTLASMRQLWRAIPSAALDRHPHLVSHVFLDPNGASIGIMQLVGGWFELQMPTGRVSFERLDEAESFAAGALAEREGVPS